MADAVFGLCSTHVPVGLSLILIQYNYVVVSLVSDLFGISSFCDFRSALSSRYGVADQSWLSWIAVSAFAGVVSGSPPRAMAPCFAPWLRSMASLHGFPPWLCSIASLHGFALWLLFLWRWLALLGIAPLPSDWAFCSRSPASQNRFLASPIGIRWREASGSSFLGLANQCPVRVGVAPLIGVRCLFLGQWWMVCGVFMIHCGSGRVFWLSPVASMVLGEFIPDLYLSH